jgi:hypothetical protein
MPAATAAATPRAPAPPVASFTAAPVAPAARARSLLPFTRALALAHGFDEELTGDNGRLVALDDEGLFHAPLVPHRDHLVVHHVERGANHPLGAREDLGPGENAEGGVRAEGCVCVCVCVC